MRQRELLAEERNRQDERHRGADVLQKPDHRHADAVRGGRVQQQRHRGGHAAAHQQRDQKRRIVYRNGIGDSGRELPDPWEHGARRQDRATQHARQQRFECHAGQCGIAAALFDRPVDAERDGQHKDDPDVAAVDHQEEHHSDAGEDGGRKLHGGEPLAEHDHPQRDVAQRTQVIAHAGLQHMPGARRPYVDAPVHRDDKARRHKRADCARIL